ncbi:MAG: LysR family transcriptional regulator [Sedimentisphaerales bacterium]|nr:LysR family transcriptional regulator [Sedimentisphaerales bacterium]
MNIKVKVWLTDNKGIGFLGEGRWRLLREVHRQGCLQKAAQALGISYRKAWGDIRTMEKALNLELVHRRRGGSHGGTSKLTEEAHKLLKAFESVRNKTEVYAGQQFEKHLKNILKSRKSTVNSRLQ